MKQLASPAPKTKTHSTFARLASQREYGVLALFIASVIIVWAVNHSFIAVNNIRDILVQCAPFAIMACGMTFVIVMGEIDISVGSMVGFLAAIVGVCCSTQKMGWPVGITILITLAAGTILGLINGLLVTLGRVPSIIVTLGMLTALRGVTQVIMGGTWIENLPPTLRYLGTSSILGVPISVLVACIVITASIIMARCTPLGRRIYAAGSNPEAARISGLPVRKLKILVFALMGLLTAIATLVSVPQLSVIESGLGVGWEMVVVTCVVVGGASISGGKGTITGSMLGVLLLGIVRTALIYLKMGDQATYWERAIQGLFILGAVLVDRLARRGRGSEGNL